MCWFNLASWITSDPGFSVATTSTKSPPVIKGDIRRVLDRMQVQYRETKTGFDCIHMPSIDLSSVQSPTRRDNHHTHGKRGSSDSSHTTGRSVARKASILSFGTMGKEKSKERPGELRTPTPTPQVALHEAPKDGGGGSLAPSASQGLTPTPSGSSSFFNVSAQTHAATDGNHAPPSTSSAASAQEDNVTLASATGDADAPPTPRPRSPAAVKTLPPIPRDYALAAPAVPAPMERAPTPVMPTGEVDPEVFDSIKMNSLAVRFDINIVKVRHLHFGISRSTDSDGVYPHRYP